MKLNTVAVSVALFALCLVFGVFVNARAAELELSAGGSYANPQQCGVWYTCGQGQPHTLHLTSANWSVGLRGDWWRAGYTSLGRFSSEALAYPTPGAQLAQFNGSGAIEGVYTTLVLPVDPVSIEIGPWLYRASWDENISNWNGVNWPAGVTPYTGTVHSTGSAASVGMMAGVEYRIGRFSVALTSRSGQNRGVTQVRWIGYPVQSDGGLQMSIVKQVVTTLELRVSL